jgi:CheY-like chemotaxis protein
MTDRQILMADDDADDRFLLKAAFEDNEVPNPIIFFEDGERLLDYLLGVSLDNHPLLIFLDLNMPKRDGREVLLALRNNENWNTIPIIIFSTSNAPEDIRSAYQLGANCYIIKPSSYEGLKEVILNVQKFWLHTAALPHLP